MFLGIIVARCGGDGDDLGHLAEMRANEAGEGSCGACAVVADDFGGGDAADAAAGLQLVATGDSKEEPGGVQVAGAGGVDDVVDGLRVDVDLFVCCDDEGTLFAARDDGDFAEATHLGDGVIEVLGFEERGDLSFVCEEDVDMAGDEVEEGGTVAVYAERVGEGEGDLAIGAVGDLGGSNEGRFGRFLVEEVALEVGNGGAG